MNNEERIMSLGSPVEDKEFVHLLRSRLHFLLKNITRNPEMFPGSQPVSFEKRHLDSLEREDYYVCEKSDGVRYLLYFAIPPSGPVAFLIDRNYNFRALDHLTLPTRDLRGFQEETLLDGELVWDERGSEMVYYIFDGIMFMAKDLTGMDLNGRLQVVQNDVIGPYKAREERKSKSSNVDVAVSVYEQTFPFKLRMKQMWKPYGLRELFERVIPSQGHENDGLIFTPVRDGYVAGTCHRLLKWKPSEMNSVDFEIVINGNGAGKGQLFMASHGRPCYYTDFEPEKDIELMSNCSGAITDLNGKIAEFRSTPTHPNRWTFMRFRPDKRLPNDAKTVEKVLQSIKDNVRREDLLAREAVIRANWKAREGAKVNNIGVKSMDGDTKSKNNNNNNSNSNNNSNNNSYNTSTSSSSETLLPRSQTLNPPAPFKYPLNLRTDAAKAAYCEADGWIFEPDNESDNDKKVNDNDNEKNYNDNDKNDNDNEPEKERKCKRTKIEK